MYIMLATMREVMAAKIGPPAAISFIKPIFLW
jgi:hypothetical protein